MTVRDDDGRTVVSTENAPPPAGSYSQAVIANGVVYLAGQTPRLPDGTRLGDAPFATQARQAFRNLQAVAEAAGTSLRRALSMTVYLADPEDRVECDAIWQEFFSEPWPARAVVQSDLPGFAIEVAGICLAAGDEP